MALLDDIKAHLEDSVVNLQNRLDVHNQMLDKINAELANPGTEARLQQLIDKATPLVDALKVGTPIVPADPVANG